MKFCPTNSIVSHLLIRTAPDERVAEFLRVLRLIDLDMYHRLMQEAMWAQESELKSGPIVGERGGSRTRAFPITMKR